MNEPRVSAGSIATAASISQLRETVSFCRDTPLGDLFFCLSCLFSSSLLTSDRTNCRFISALASASAVALLCFCRGLGLGSRNGLEEGVSVERGGKNSVEMGAKCSSLLMRRTGISQPETSEYLRCVRAWGWLRGNACVSVCYTYIACESELRSYLSEEISNSIPQSYCARPGARATEDHPGGVV